MVFQKTSELLESQVEAGLAALKIARSELLSLQKSAPSSQIDLKPCETFRQKVEFDQSEEEEKKGVKRSVGRPPKNRVVESSSAGSETKVPLSGLRKSRNEDTQYQINGVLSVEEA